ncbi:MAG: VCBS repeat-containing protein, partial [Gemmataceae bacterium]|nr:VCBS repeat-containing protein [Gemmataceae bacterium]
APRQTTPPAATKPPAQTVVGGGTGAVVFTPSPTGQFAPTPAASLNPFPAGGGAAVRSATGDVDGDGVPDTVLVTGPGAPLRFAVVSGADHATVLVPPKAPFAGSEGFAGGGFTAAADLDGDGKAEFAVTPDEGGGPRVTVFSLVSGSPTQRANFFGIDDPAFRGGARAALGDVNRDGVPDLVVAAGFLGGPRAVVFDGRTLLGGQTPTKLVGDFFAFPGTDAVTLRNGAFVAVGDLDGDGYGELIFGGGPGGAPRVFALSGQLMSAGNVAGAQASPVSNFFVAGNTADRGGTRVAARDIDGDGKADLIVGSGQNAPARVRAYLGKDITSAAEPLTFQDLRPFGGATLPDGVHLG